MRRGREIWERKDSTIEREGYIDNSYDDEGQEKLEVGRRRKKKSKKKD